MIFDANRDHQDRIYIGQALRNPKALPAAENGGKAASEAPHEGRLVASPGEIRQSNVVE